MFCTHCGNEVDDKAVICPNCGCAVSDKYLLSKRKSWLASFLMCWFMGVFGLHRFYLGQIGTGIAQVLTFGGCGILTLCDLISLALNKYRDNEGNELKEYMPTVAVIGVVCFVLGILVNILAVAISD